MTLSANFTSKSVFDQQEQGCRALTFALARLSCYFTLLCNYIYGMETDMAI